MPPTRPRRVKRPRVSEARIVAETVQHFITAMDSLKLEMTAVDQLYPILSDLLASLGRITQLPPDWSGKLKVCCVCAYV